MSEESLLTTAYQFIQIGETQTAERLLTGLIRKEPRSEAAWLLLAACKRLPEEKEKCLEFVAEINPQNGPALQALGELISGRDADALILRAFEDWQTREEELGKMEVPITPLPDLHEEITEAAEESGHTTCTAQTCAYPLAMAGRHSTGGGSGAVLASYPGTGAGSCGSTGARAVIAEYF